MAETTLPGAGARFRYGVFNDNPIYRQLLGMCPTLAVTASLAGAFTMAAATTFVLIMASAVVSLLRNQLKGHLRILVFTMTIATFVTIVDRFLGAYVYSMSMELGPYIPLIIVNCIIICRCEVCASQQPIHVAISDAAGQGVGFLVGLTSIAAVRELLATGGFFLAKSSEGVETGLRLLPNWPNWAVMAGPAGAFITLGLLIGVVNLISMRKKKS